MALEYILDLHCAVKEEFDTESLVNLVKSRNQAEVILDHLRREGNQRSPAEIQITRRIQTPLGIQDHETSIQDMLDDSAALNPLAHYCTNCQANVCGRPFGCYGAVTYPIQAATEQWLLGLLPTRLESTAGQILTSTIADFQFDGAPVAQMRAQDPFFELKRPPARSWGSWVSKTTITADEMWHMLLCLEGLAPAHCLMMALFLGLIPHETPPQDLSGEAAQQQALAEARLPAAPAGKGQIQDTVLFLRAVLLSARLEVPLLTSS
jgi:hypothetical protein